ncbi:NAD(P)/FAD-dependent oxidoreductase [Spongiibacter pelagi]
MTAAQRGQRVLVLEKANKVGKKILMSGGGRCNFTNHFVSAENYISDNRHFCKAALKRYSQWDFIGMVERYAIPYEERKHSQLFCLNSAKDILEMLLNECEQAGVEIRCKAEAKQVQAIDQHSARYQIKLVDENGAATLTCRSLVVATGGLSIPTLGGSDLGYQIARQFGLEVTPLQAGLVPFMFSDSDKKLSMKSLCETLSGLALEVEMHCNNTYFRENLLFTHRGMSGPVVLQISNYWHPGDTVSINLLPDTNAEQLLLTAKQQQGKSLLRTVLSQHLSKGLVGELQQRWWPEQADTALAEFSDKALINIAQQLNDWQIKPSSTEGYRTAEVTLGGVHTKALSSKTLEVTSQPGLFFIGEVVDVTGWLGGFNFQWAWSSGYSAGLAV